MRKEKISAVYQIINTVTGDRYVGSSRDVNRRYLEHRRPSRWDTYSNNPLYQDMQKYGLENFRFQILAPVMEEYLKQVEQEFIEMLNPTYNQVNAYGIDIEKDKAANRRYNQSDKRKEASKRWRQSEKGKEYEKEYGKMYRQTEKGKASAKARQEKYRQTEKCKETRKKYYSQLCNYNGKTLTLKSLINHFYKAGIHHPNIEASKYIIRGE